MSLPRRTPHQEIITLHAGKEQNPSGTRLLVQDTVRGRFPGSMGMLLDDTGAKSATITKF